MFRKARLPLSGAAIAFLSSCAGGPSPVERDLAVVGGGSAERCAALAEGLAIAWPDASTKLTSAQYREAGPLHAPPGIPGPPAPPVTLPAHCDITGMLQQRTGVDGQDYAIRFHLRLPDQWNGRFFMQGGGGTNGVLGDAVGSLRAAPPALAQGFAVMSQDSGHDNAINSVPGRGGASAFGFDPKARADYGGDSLEASTLAAKALVRSYYGSDPRYSYFVGCSKGGQEGMALAQQYPNLYDGIVAGAPGFSLPRAAIAEAWNTQAFASVLEARGEAVTMSSFATSFSGADLGLVRDAVLEACDAQDGLADGLVGAFAQCKSDMVVPQLRARQCSADGEDECLLSAQIDALQAIHQGPRTSGGKQLYPGFAWDAGWADTGWRIWMTGVPEFGAPSINVAMGAPSLAAVFSSPPQAFDGVEGNLAYMLGYDFDRDPASVDAVIEPFVRSAWDDISARSSDLDTFRRRGGKLIVTHGVSDPVFSVIDTLAWWDEVAARYPGSADRFARVFPVPGMGHCQGGPATDRFDDFGALVRWVEQGDPPDRLAATAGPMSPWPGRERPLCPYPLVARPVEGASDLNDASAFECQ
ncbi:tannase/feruloyl esterase family alpha/beta hydrolase [Aurantiacibacter poecillastricola]|uniref:tannase/feruloyl esterase family alpha/beta hydrolase n=1 Tax=Aurantiacibacter poecillastricola TaxID=3064385 RepID=UPI00273E4404|nr:tannase/feruloyl esterase family alpha/beta hydrolase [Aurantiacibacter sp. 219JJ12-13]MDP5261241.1 tannase/feruloyl esterase family alpha/beta hydrolase [Aurantiacibacter sp. 219JJ12-13]